MAKRADLVGQRFGRLVVEEYAFTRKNAAFWKCKCDCGNYVDVPTHSLRCGNTRSCGCYRLEKQSETREDLHKYSGSYTSKHRPRLYWTWLNMIRRCENPKAPDYYRYGALGISVCEEWHDLPTFLDWAYSHNWAEGLTLDRIDNEGNYCPENCRWADRYTQGNNMRTNTFLEFNGKKQTVANWARELGVTPEVLYGRIERGWPIEDIIQTPSGVTPKFKRGTSVQIVEYGGESHTLHEWSKITGLSACCIGYRIKAGWTVEDALTKPSKRRTKKSN